MIKILPQYDFSPRQRTLQEHLASLLEAQPFEKKAAISKPPFSQNPSSWHVDQASNGELLLFKDEEVYARILNKVASHKLFASISLDLLEMIVTSYSNDLSYKAQEAFHLFVENPDIEISDPSIIEDLIWFFDSVLRPAIPEDVEFYLDKLREKQLNVSE